MEEEVEREREREKEKDVCMCDLVFLHRRYYSYHLTVPAIRALLGNGPGHGERKCTRWASMSTLVT